MGTKRITVKQFRAMSDEAAYKLWSDCSWPFDGATGCITCLTQHDVSYPCCADAKHTGLVKAVGKLNVDSVAYWSNRGAWLKANAAKLFALRKKFDKLYR